jgi:uncharacterized protein YndB with AHSA1/START domain
MSRPREESRTVTVERDIAFPPERLWRALTQPDLMAEWLMQSDFVPTIDHHFTLRADWGSVECKVLAIEPMRSLSYTWSAMGLETIVTWTLTPILAGTHLRMEQTGFKSSEEQAYRGAQVGWPRFLEKLEALLAKQ